MWKKVTLVFAIPMLVSACAGSRSASKGTHHHYNTAGRYALPKSDVPLVVNDKVVAWVDYFTGPGRDRFGRYIKRSGRYIPMMRQILKSYGMPQDIVYLAMIESGFASKAKSHAAAVGVWQFIRATGNRYGLDQDVWIDERQDVEKETHAAAQYLRDLYSEFGDWYLAFAAYNAGEGTVRRAISHNGTKDFWELSNPRTGAFRAETRDYVPKYIAAAIIAKNPEQFGFSHIQPDAPITYEVVTVDTHVDIDVIAKCAGVDVDTIDIMNSELKLGTAPPKYKVKIPVGSTKKFQVALARIAPEDRVKTIAMTEKHTVGKGESLKSIAHQFGAKPSAILAASGLRNARAVKRGVTLTIPMGDLKSTLIARSGGAIRKSGGAMASGMYKVRRGDNLKSVSNKYDVSVADLRDWNGLNGRHADLKVGSVIRVQQADAESDAAPSLATSSLVSKSAPTMPVEPRGKSAARIAAAAAPSAPAVAVDAGTLATGYVVSIGDSWNSVSQNVGLPTKTIKQLNPEVASKGLQVGDVLRLNKSSQSVASADAVSSADAPSVAPVVATDAPVRPVEKVEVDSAVDSPISKVAPARESTKAVKTSKATYYKVRSGDSLDKIADKYDVSVSDLKEWNQIAKANRIHPGQKIQVTAPVQAKQTGTHGVPKSASTRVATKVSKAEPLRNNKKNRVVTYKVKPGDNLWTIGKKHNISPDQMKQLSQLKHGGLKPGDVITLRVGS